MYVTDLDGNRCLSVIAGNEYMVPCVLGIPIIVPSHIDEGPEGQTSRHWHVDDRFGDYEIPYELCSKETQESFSMGESNKLRTATIRDDGQEVVLERLVAKKNKIIPSGELFTSLCWLYNNLGHIEANNKHCAHHHTPLVDQDNCLYCPAHGLKYNQDGSPKYKAPFYLSVRYIDSNHDIKRIKQPLKTDGTGMHFKVDGAFDIFPLVALEDSDGEIIMEYRSPHRINKANSYLDISIVAWPSDGKCPSLINPNKGN